jgi:hypothetical protein
MAPADAQLYWMSAEIPNDQFLLYAFAGVPDDIGRAVTDAMAWAGRCPSLRIRVDETGSRLRYPVWADRDVDVDQFSLAAGDEVDWPACLQVVVGLADNQLDLRQRAWRLHVYAPVHGVPGVGGPATVAVVQMGHALADGTRAATLAGVLFGRAATVYPVGRPARTHLLGRATAAARAHRQAQRDIAAGVLAPPADPRPALSTNNRPAGARLLRTVVRPRAELAGPTITVGVLTAISAALSAHLQEHGADASTLGAEVPMAKEGVPQANNHFRNVGIGLHPQAASAQDRARLIAAELDTRRRRGRHPVFAASDRAVVAVPAPLLRWGVSQFDVEARSNVVTGNTVVSSVNRGAADLKFGGCPVVFTAGYPALSPMMGLTHGVHGIGDTVAVSVHAAESALVDVDAYVDRLQAALRR